VNGLECWNASYFEANDWSLWETLPVVQGHQYELWDWPYAPDNEVSATWACGVTSFTVSTSFATSSRGAFIWVAITAWIWVGKRFDHKVRKKSCGIEDPPRFARCRKNWDGFLSPISSWINSWRTCCSFEDVRRSINLVLSLWNLPVSGGLEMMSLSSLITGSSSWEIA